MPYGEDSNFGVAIQADSAYNVSSFFWIPILSENVEMKIDPRMQETMKGLYDEHDPYESGRIIEGDFDTESNPILMGTLLRGMCGETATLVDSAYSHSFLPVQSDFSENFAHPPLTIHKYFADGGSADLFYNMQISTLEFAIANGELLKVKASVLGGTNVQIANVSASYLEEPEPILWDAASVSLGGSAVGDMKDATITITNPLENHHTLGNTKYPSHTKRNGMRAVDISGTYIFTNQDDYQDWKARSKQQLIIFCKSTTEASSGHPISIKFDVPEFVFNEFPLSAGGPGQMEVSFVGKGYYHSDSGTAIEVTLVNTHAAYQ